MVWGEFDAELVRLRDPARGGTGRPADDGPAPVPAVIETNRFGTDELDELRIRIGLTSTVPTLIAHSAVRYAQWCNIVAGFAARRLGASPEQPCTPDRGPGRARVPRRPRSSAFRTTRWGDNWVAEVDPAC